MNRYALYIGDFDDAPVIPHSFGDSIDGLRSLALKSECDWYKIVDVSQQPFVLIEKEDITTIRRRLCKHRNTYRVEPTRGGAVLASGQDQTPGEYCRDCGERVGD